MEFDFLFLRAKMSELAGWPAQKECKWALKSNISGGPTLAQYGVFPPLPCPIACFASLNEREMAGGGAFWGTRVMDIVKKHDSGGLVWKRIKLTTTRKANAKKRLLRVWQNEAVLRACAEPPPSESSTASSTGMEEKDSNNA